MNKLHILVLLFITLAFNCFATKPRKKTDVGFFLGTSSYMGDINQSRLFYRPGPAIGGLIRWRLNETYAIRGQFVYGQFSAADKDFSNPYQQIRNASFNSSLLDFGLIGEYNFVPFKFDERKKVLSPYLFTGFGYDHILTSSGNIDNHFNVPFGVGIKYSLKRKITIGLEYSFRKLLSDNADGVHNPGGNEYKTTFSNKDWYSFAGIFITFGLFGNQGNCPVYQ